MKKSLLLQLFGAVCGLVMMITAVVAGAFDDECQQLVKRCKHLSSEYEYSPSTWGRKFRSTCAGFSAMRATQEVHEGHCAIISFKLDDIKVGEGSAWERNY